MYESLASTMRGVLKKQIKKLEKKKNDKQQHAHAYYYNYKLLQIFFFLYIDLFM